MGIEPLEVAVFLDGEGEAIAEFRATAAPRIGDCLVIGKDRYRVHGVDWIILDGDLFSVGVDVVLLDTGKG